MKRLVIYFPLVLLASAFAGCCRWCDEHPNAGLWRDPHPGYGYYGQPYGGQPVTYAPMAGQVACPCECVPAATPVAK